MSRYPYTPVPLGRVHMSETNLVKFIILRREKGENSGRPVAHRPVSSYKGSLPKLKPTNEDPVSDEANPKENADSTISHSSSIRQGTVKSHPKYTKRTSGDLLSGPRSFKDTRAETPTEVYTIHKTPPTPSKHRRPITGKSEGARADTKTYLQKKAETKEALKEEREAKKLARKSKRQEKAEAKEARRRARKARRKAKKATQALRARLADKRVAKRKKL